MTSIRLARRSLWPWASLPVAGLFALLGASLGLAADPPKPAKPVPAESPKPASGHDAPDPGFKIGEIETATCPAQICYEIRVLSIGDPAWKDAMNGRMREIHGDAETTAWLLDPKTSTDCLTSLQGDRRNEIIQSPKPTILDGKSIIIDDRMNTYYVAELEKIETAKYALAFRPTIGSFKIGPRIEIGGKIHLGSVLMNLDLNDTSLVAMHSRQTRASLKPSARASEENSTITGTTQFPILASKRYQGVSNMPDGTSLLISLGYVEERVDLPPMIDWAIKIVAAIVGGPNVEAERIVRERLVMITPMVLVFPRDVKPFTPTVQTSYLDFGATAMY